MAEVIPLFPLSHVLLPGMPLPLHIFEQRYRELLDDLADAPGGARFGVVALRSGTEAASPDDGGDTGLADGPDSGRDSGLDGGPDSAPHSAPHGGPDVEPVGTLAEILEVEPRDDGTSDLLSVGSRRFRIARLLPEGRPYLRAEVEFLDEVDGAVTAEHAACARELLERYDALLMRLAGRATGAELPDDPTQLSYQVAARLPLPPAERQALLTDDTTAARLERLAALLRREIALLQRTRSIAVSPAVLRLLAGAN